MAIDVNLLHAVEGLSRIAAGSVVAGLWQGLILAAGVGICLRLMPKTTAAIRFAAWTVVFAVLAEERNVSRAATRLFLSQPAVSQIGRAHV